MRTIDEAKLDAADYVLSQIYPQPTFVDLNDYYAAAASIPNAGSPATSTGAMNNSIPVNTQMPIVYHTTPPANASLSPPDLLNHHHHHQQQQSQQQQQHHHHLNHQHQNRNNNSNQIAMQQTQLIQQQQQTAQMPPVSNGQPSNSNDLNSFYSSQQAAVNQHVQHVNRPGEYFTTNAPSMMQPQYLVDPTGINKYKCISF